MHGAVRRRALDDAGSGGRRVRGGLRSVGLGPGWGAAVRRRPAAAGGGRVGCRGPADLRRPGCSGCHTFAAAGATQTIGPDLDEVLPDRSPQEIEQSIVDPDSELSPGFNRDHARQLRRLVEPGRSSTPSSSTCPRTRARAVAGNKIGELMPVALKQSRPVSGLPRGADRRRVRTRARRRAARDLGPPYSRPSRRATRR